MKNSLLSDITTRLTSISDSPALDASVLIAHVTNKSRTWVLSHPELTLTTKQQKLLNDSLKRLENGKPLPYVLGHWEFFGLDFDITSDVLIPRPETELLVEEATAWLNNNPKQRNIADVGTGSGAIAISLAVNMPDANILATDITPKALQVAKRNAEKHGVLNKITFIECDLLPEGASIDLLCANLPYIPTETLHKLPVFGREPTLALDGGRDGFEVIQRLMDIAPKHIKPNSLMLFEIEETLGKEALALAKKSFSKAKIKLHKDLSGCDRLLRIQLP
ncbi:MAG TPA: peptide chain release factor N(5)-glutamine methyltransferase [Anaerolineales bacterium]|nr:peptide chain release factor N(5)-glutamine methyltransferase [Anaerolineales bacterium]